MDKEKIINGLKNCAVYGGCLKCSYAKTIDGKIDTDCKSKMCRDALSLINELIEESEDTK